MITLQFVEADDPTSLAIQIFERGWPSHVDIVIPGGIDGMTPGGLLGARSDYITPPNTMIDQGIPAGVQIRPPNYATWKRVEQINLNLTPYDANIFFAFLQKQIGKPYDSTAIAAFPFERDWREQDSWFCSELACAALEACGFFPKPLANPANEITPRDLLLIVSPWRI